MSDIIKGLAEKAAANLAQAQQDVLGFRTDSAIDIEVVANSPVLNYRNLIARTAAGHAFINKFYFTRTIPLAEFYKFAAKADHWGLRFVSVWEPEEL